MLSNVLIAAAFVFIMATIFALIMSAKTYHSEEKSHTSVWRVLAGAALCLSGLSFGMWGALRHAQADTGTIVVVMVMIACALCVSGLFDLARSRTRRF